MKVSQKRKHPWAINILKMFWLISNTMLKQQGNTILNQMANIKPDNVRCILLCMSQGFIDKIKLKFQICYLLVVSFKLYLKFPHLQYAEYDFSAGLGGTMIMPNQYPL